MSNVDNLSLLNNVNLDSDTDMSCKYYNIEQFQDLVKNCCSEFSSMSLNIRSLANKFDELKDFINDINNDTFKFDIICIQEIWSIPFHFNLNINGYKPLISRLRQAKDINNRNLGGGIGI